MLPCSQPVFIQLSCNSASINIPDVSRLICMWHGVHLGHVMHCHAHFYQGDQSHAWQKVEVQIEMARIYNIAITHYIFNNMYTYIYIYIIYIYVCVCVLRAGDVWNIFQRKWGSGVAPGKLDMLWRHPVPSVPSVQERFQAKHGC